MIKRILTTIGAGCVLALASGTASATPLTFDFTGGPVNGANSLVFTSGSITLTVTAFRSNGDQEQVTQNGNGLGVCTTPAEAPCNEATTGEKRLDSIGPNEELHFSISGLSGGMSLVLDTLTFTSFNLSNPNRDNFRMWADGAQVTNGKFKPGTNPWTIADDFGVVDVLSDFYIRAVPAADGTESSFRIAGLTAHLVPEPGSLALLGLGLVGMGFARRKKA